MYSSNHTIENYEPGYLELHRQGELSQRADALWRRLESCDICPHQCGVNRLRGEMGICRTGNEAMVSSFGPHFGEESPLVGRGGSGTIFFTHCNLGCLFCQNYDISHLGGGSPIKPEKLSGMMIALQNMGCHNLNFVTPTHVVPQILKALVNAIDMGLNVPLVYNTGGYDSLTTLELLDGIFDIYMPDLKYSDNKAAERYCNAKDYVQVARQATKTMHQQVGDLVIDHNGVAQRGLLVRHLILPDDLAGTREAMKFIAEEISTNTYVNLMDQYLPCYKADEHPPLDRRITTKEFTRAIEIARELGIERID